MFVVYLHFSFFFHINLKLYAWRDVWKQKRSGWEIYFGNTKPGIGFITSDTMIIYIWVMTYDIIGHVRAFLKFKQIRSRDHYATHVDQWKIISWDIPNHVFCIPHFPVYPHWLFPSLTWTDVFLLIWCEHRFSLSNRQKIFNAHLLSLIVNKNRSDIWTQKSRLFVPSCQSCMHMYLLII